MSPPSIVTTTNITTLLLPLENFVAPTIIEEAKKSSPLMIGVCLNKYSARSSVIIFCCKFLLSCSSSIKPGINASLLLRISIVQSLFRLAHNLEDNKVFRFVSLQSCYFACQMFEPLVYSWLPLIYVR